MKRVIEWVAHNSVFANLLMVIMLIVGVIAVFQIRSEEFPEFSLSAVTIQVTWEGASPAEVEEGVCIKIEEAISSVEGVKEITSTAFEHRCNVNMKLHSWVDDSRELMEDISSEIDRINTFPADIEKPVITEVKQRSIVGYLSLYGEVSEWILKRRTTEVKDDLLGMPNISKITMDGLREWEITIEVSEETRRRHGLTFAQLASIIRRNVLELSGGDIRSSEQRIRVRTLGKRYTGREFEQLEILTRPDGTILRLGDIARVTDGFEENDKSGRFNGQPATLIRVFRTGAEDALSIAKTIQEYVKKKQKELPKGLHLSYWGDRSRLIQNRLDLLLRNGRIGLVLVFISLWLFLNIRLSFWVAMGIPVSLLTSLGFLHVSGGSLNMITMFSFIMVLGILVDDAIVVAENIYSHMQRGGNRIQAAIDGCHEVILPVIAAVTTSIVAFIPLTMMEGNLGKFMAMLPLAIIAALIASLIESLFILPAHLAHWVRPAKKDTLGSRIRGAIDRAVNMLIHRIYGPILKFCLDARYLVAAIALAIFMLTIGLSVGGHVRFLFFPKLDSDWLVSGFEFPRGTPVERTKLATEKIEKAILSLNKDLQSRTGEPVIQHVFAMPGRGGSHAGLLFAELLPSEARGINSEEISNQWRDKTGEISDVVTLHFHPINNTPPGGKPIDVQFYGNNINDLKKVSMAFAQELRRYPGVHTIENDFRDGKLELRTSLKPQARVLGVSLDDLAQQLRARFFGLQVLRLQRGRDDVKMKLRYPLDERNSIEDVREIRIRTSSGAEVPLHEVAEVKMTRGLDQIKRMSGSRVVNVTAEVDPKRANPTEIITDLEKDFFSKILSRHEETRYRFGGQAQASADSFASLLRAFAFALAVIFAILAILFRSYFQPLIVMATIPFGVVGAVWGHVIMGHTLSIMSVLGIVALSGVVVNDSLVLLGFANRSIKDGMPVEDALYLAGVSRWRAIILTTVTTAAGLGPMLLEQSFQAQFLIPMAISMCFGLLFATVITLILVPVISLISNDMGRLGWRIWAGKWLTREEVDVHSPQNGPMGA